jgi:hypothetical protein
VNKSISHGAISDNLFDANQHVDKPDSNDCHGRDTGFRRLAERFRLPDLPIEFFSDYDGVGEAGFFRMGSDAVCFGHCKQETTRSLSEMTPDVIHLISQTGNVVHLPFSADEVVDNLLLERYVRKQQGMTAQSQLRLLYYMLRPILPVHIRKYLQRISLVGWKSISFPRWPVDFSVDRIFEKLIILAMRSMGVNQLPFIWFWPGTMQSCAIMTHDVEELAGLNFCTELMDMNDTRGIKSSFQLIPEARYSVSQSFLDSVRARGFEIAVHDLHHDAKLFRSEIDFLQRIVAVNRYGKIFKTSGFRSGALYRNQQWYEHLDFQYDMSVPNVAHLEPQRGGCCTVFPYFVGKTLELPLTITQDYAILYFLNDNSIDLWFHQIEMIRREYGLISILVHPDYLITTHSKDNYLKLLCYLDDLRTNQQLWIATPAELNSWWRLRNSMKLEMHYGAWKICGQGSERARVAFANLEDGKLSYLVQ